MAASADRIKELLGNGLSNDVVATAVGVHPSYVSQLMSDEIFSQQVIALRTQTLAAASSRDRSWDGIEDRLLNKLSDLVDSGMFYKPQDILNALVVANRAKRRGTTAQENLVVHQNIVHLNLPTQVVNSYRKNLQGEVVEITTPEGNQQTLVTMPAVALVQKLAEAEKDGKYDKVRRYLPQGSKKENSTG